VRELREKLDAGETPLILDLRSSAAVEQDPVLIQGAIHVSMHDIEERQSQLPRDRDIIVYCSCPNEVSSARLALQLQRKGFTRVRPLLGGIDAWREQNYPVEPRAALGARTDIMGAGKREPVLPDRGETHQLQSAEVQPAQPAGGETT